MTSLLTEDRYLLGCTRTLRKVLTGLTIHIHIKASKGHYSTQDPGRPPESVQLNPPLAKHIVSGWPSSRHPLLPALSSRNRGFALF